MVGYRRCNLIRIVKLFLWSLDKRIDIAYSNAFLSSVIGRVRGFHSYTFDDDPQTFDFRPKIWFSKISHYCLYELPPGYVLSSKVKVLPALKEWAYLAPNVFTPDRIFLDKYKLHPKEYFFVREVSVGTVNYTGQHVGAVMGIASKIPHGRKCCFLWKINPRKRGILKIGFCWKSRSRASILLFIIVVL